MSKKRVERWIPVARRAITECKIETDGKIDEMFPGRVASFGAAIISGTLRSAVAFFSQRGNAAIERNKLVSAAYYCISGENLKAEKVFECICNDNTPDLKEQFLDALSAIRYAMNFFTFVNDEGQNE